MALQALQQTKSGQKSKKVGNHWYKPTHECRSCTT